ncbi:hypothetical protein ACHAW5_011144 [Stephanodiscus triporus]|uniref:Epoxyqueuosine reductase QueH n=1 Tax=Stephanodiscus triporus TaxID=2934178 RepID=A0ABD3QWC7_9STRA
MTTSCATAAEDDNNDVPSPPPLSYSEGAKLPSNAPSWAISASERLARRRRLRSSSSSSSSSSASSSPPPSHPPSSVDPPPGVTRVLLHSCCAPCSGAMIEEMLSAPALEEVVVFFYNPNIHPRREYEIRKDENKRHCEALGIVFVDVDYDPEAWHARTRGMEYDPERGRRCTACFDMRMEHARPTTTNATSRWKDAVQVDASGVRAVEGYGGRLVYWRRDWQTDEMTLRKYEVSARERFYKQEYCGCSHSLRDSNDWRKANGIPRIRIGGETAGLGGRYFTDPIKDAEEESRDVVDEFFAVANEIAGVVSTTGDGEDLVARRREALRAYGERRKCEKDDGVVNGLNNW